MSKRIEVTLALVENGDWEGLYIDGVLVHENSSIPAWVLIKALKDADRAISVAKEVVVSSEWMDDRGSFPEDEKGLEGHLIEDSTVISA